jgi:hypothetical protein
MLILLIPDSYEMRRMEEPYFVPISTYLGQLAFIIFWDIVQLLSNDRETNDETTAVARQRPARNRVSYVARSVAVSRDRKISVSLWRVPITVAARSEAWTVIALLTLGTWVRISLKAWISVYLYSVFVLFCV